MKSKFKALPILIITSVTFLTACNYTFGVDESVHDDKLFEDLLVDPGFDYSLNELHQINENGKILNVYSYVDDDIYFLGKTIGGDEGRIQIESSVDGFYYDIVPNSIYQQKNTTSSSRNNKIVICHIPPGFPENAHTIEIAESAWPAHRDNHGDTLGACESDSFEDSDGDGVVDYIDDYPNDSLFAFTSYYPGNEEFATLLFEDMWPLKGDYDFNDFVLYYKLTYKKNSLNKIVGIDYTYKVAAIGGIKSSSFYVRLLDKNVVPLPYHVVDDVSGSNLSNGFASVRSNGTETGTEEAVIPIIDNTRNAFENVTSRQKINVIVGNPVIDSDTSTISILLNEPYNENEVYFDPFIVMEYEREREIHLPVFGPTDKARYSNYFGTDDDNTDLNNDYYYKSHNHFPWALNVPREIIYPKENADFSIAYNEFSEWAESGGNSRKQWYFQQVGKYKPNKVFRRNNN